MPKDSEESHPRRIGDGGGRGRRVIDGNGAVDAINKYINKFGITGTRFPTFREGCYKDVQREN